MKAKSIITVVLLAFVGVSVAYLIVQEPRSKPAVQSGSGRMAVARSQSKAPDDVEPTLSEADQQTGHRLIAYYFHRTQRCPTCLTMETYAEEALRDGFPEALESGDLEWRTVNVEDPESEHFVEDYELSTSALVMVSVENGEEKQWKNLEHIWDLVGDEWGFKEYVRDEAMAYLESGF